MDNIQVTSARNTVNISKGKIGLAGGQRFPGQTLLGTSGLWEVHDHFVGAIYKDEVNREVNKQVAERTVDDLAGEFETIFGRIQKLHEGEQAANLGREAVFAIVSQPSRILHPNSRD